MTRRITRRGLTTIAGIAAAGLVAAATAPMAGAAPGDPSRQDKAPRPSRPGQDQEGPPKDKLGQHDRELLTRARAKGTQRVTLMVATARARRPRSSRASRPPAAGSPRSATSIGYVSASVPTGQVDALAKAAADPRRRPQRVDPAPQARGRAAAGTRCRRRSGRRPARAPRTTTRTCRPATSGRSPSRAPTTRGTAAASPSASSTPASTSTTRPCRRPAPASARSSTGSRRPTRSSTATARGARCSPRVTGPTFAVPGSAPGPAPAGTYKFNRVRREHHR